MRPHRLAMAFGDIPSAARPRASPYAVPRRVEVTRSSGMDDTTRHGEALYSLLLRADAVWAAEEPSEVFAGGVLGQVGSDARPGGYLRLRDRMLEEVGVGPACQPPSR